MILNVVTMFNSFIFYTDVFVLLYMFDYVAMQMSVYNKYHNVFNINIKYITILTVKPLIHKRCLFVLTTVKSRTEHDSPTTLKQI